MSDRLTTQRIRNMRDLHLQHQPKLRLAPEPVAATNAELISALNELLEYRDAEEQGAEERLFSQTPRMFAVPAGGQA